MAKGKLYGKKDNFRTQKVLIAAKLGKSEVQLAGETAPADKFPLGVTPAYEGESLLFGAESIALHVSGESGKNLAEIVQWLQWAEGSLLPNVLGFVLPSVSAAKLDKAVVESYKNELFALLSIFNELLLTKTFLVADRLSLADVSVALDLLPAFQYVLDEAARKKFGNVLRWFNTIVNQPVVKEVVGEVAFAKAVSQFTESEFSKFAAKLSTGDKKKANEKKETKKAEPKPAKQAAAAADEEDDVPAAPKEAKDPFADMPKGTFNMDGFKRSYSNEDTATKAIPHFWENFDAENYSIWHCEYKFPTELTLGFMSCNLISGMFQRLEKLKKNGFASMILFGTDNNSTISGIWVWRGQELAFPLSPDWQVDYESYEWKKLDPKDEKTKKMVNEYLLWEGDFDGKKFNQGKIFKDNCVTLPGVRFPSHNKYKRISQGKNIITSLAFSPTEGRSLIVADANEGLSLWKNALPAGLGEIPTVAPGPVNDASMNDDDDDEEDAPIKRRNKLILDEADDDMDAGQDNEDTRLSNDIGAIKKKYGFTEETTGRLDFGFGPISPGHQSREGTNEIKSYDLQFAIIKIVDYEFAAILTLFYVLDEAARKKFGNVLRWFNTIVNQPVVKEVVGEVAFAKAVSQFTESEFSKFAAKLSTRGDHFALTERPEEGN